MNRNLETAIDLYTTSPNLAILVAREFSLQREEIITEIINWQARFHISCLEEEPLLIYLDSLERKGNLNGVWYLLKDSSMGAHVRLRSAKGKIIIY